MTRQKESERERGSRPFRMGVFKRGNDGKVNDFKRIIRPGWGESHPCLNRYTSGFIELKKHQATIVYQSRDFNKGRQSDTHTHKKKTASVML